MPRLVGKGIALELLLSGKMIDASRALEIKLINKMIDEDKLINECCKLANKIKDNSPVAIKHTITSVNKGESSAS